MTDIEAKIKQLRDELNRHNYNYYVLNQPTIGDMEFDFKMHELEDLEKAHPEFADPLSPTQRVGSDISQGFKQVLHERPMQSLGNSYSIEEVQDFLRRAKDGLGGEPVQIVGEMKYDGTSISCTYEHGCLVRAVTRGDGVRGDDVTANVITIKSVPLQLQPGDWPDKFEVRGEILLPWASFERLNKEREFNEEPLFANPRNAAAGTLKMQNSAEVARRGLDAYFYFLLGDQLEASSPGLFSENDFSTHTGRMEALKKWGFKVAEHTILDSIDAVKDFIDQWDVQRKNLPVATDGLVFKLNSIRQWLNLGSTAKSPRWAIAYKFAPERECSPLQFISFEVGRTGVITPVANLDPVLLSGTIVKRASLHNEDIIRQLDIHEGDYLYVEKGGEIIPKIVGVDLKRRKADSRPIEFVRTCPVCGTPLTRIEGEAAWVCPNKYGCKPQITGRIEHFVARHAMNIDGIGEEVAVQLHESGLVHNIADIYSLTGNDLMRLEHFQRKASDRILSGIRKSLEVPFERVLFAIGIPYVGETTAKVLARNVHTIDRLMAMNAEELASIPEIGPKIAESIVGYFAAEGNREIIERLREAGVQLCLSEAELANRTDKLAGKKIVISGVFAKHSREEYKAMIEQNGGKNVSSISAATSYVLAGDNMGPAKLEKARKLSIPIINEEEFLAMLHPE
ncbi:MAG: NAD-dependent DNA ligase LigA [Bacteroidales bacterium]|nr:NAD-dependent DNA ligase LigA [Bacteroidales bacterium]MDY5225948.1 NAD-dependent DNA ligase LigA [Sodaliphilus sp.]